MIRCTVVSYVTVKLESCMWVFEKILGLVLIYGVKQYVMQIQLFFCFDWYSLKQNKSEFKE